MCSSERQMSLFLVFQKRWRNDCKSKWWTDSDWNSGGRLKFDFLCQPPPRLDGRSRGGARPPILFQDETVPAAVADKITTGTLSVSSSVPTHLFWRMGRLLKHFLDVLELFQSPEKKGPAASGFCYRIFSLFQKGKRKRRVDTLNSTRSLHFLQYNIFD